MSRQIYYNPYPTTLSNDWPAKGEIECSFAVYLTAPENDAVYRGIFTVYYNVIHI